MTSARCGEYNKSSSLRPQLCYRRCTRTVRSMPALIVPAPYGYPMTNPGTADPKGARAHAHAMAGTKIEAMPTVPAGLASDLPAGVMPQDMLWEEIIGAGGYASKE